MNVHLNILGFQTLDAIPDYWSLQDYHALLQRCEVDDFAQMSFSDAEVQALEDHEYTAITSRYWIERDELNATISPSGL